MMTKKYLILLAAFLLSLFVQAQEINPQLFGEGNGDVVRLMWVPQQWPENLEGFDIKRRAVNGNQTSGWVQLNDGLIYPELSLAGDLSKVEKSSEEQQRLRQKLDSLINAGRASEILRDNYYEEILSRENGLRNMSLAAVVDFDIALLNGFALVDRNMPKAEVYEYGLFPKFRNQPGVAEPVSTYRWQYGSRPVTNVDIEVKARSQGSKRRVLITWTVDTDDFQKKRLAGFNLYKRSSGQPYSRINDRIILLSVKNNPEYLVHQEVLDNSDDIYEFAAVPITMFGTEGERTEVLYDPSKMAVNLNPPLLQHDPKQSPGVYLFWAMEESTREQVKGIVIESKANIADDFAPVSPVLSADVNSYTDDPGVSGYYFYRTKLIRHDDTEIPGKEITLFYQFSSIPQQPGQLSAEWVGENNSGYVQLRWGAIDDPEMNGYRIFIKKPARSSLVYDATIPLVKNTSYRYEIGEYVRGEWQFAIAAVSSTNDQGELSNTVSVMTPSVTIPNVYNRNVDQNGNQAVLSWQYPDDIDDLAGFRIFENGELMADESEIGKRSRNWSSSPLEEGKRYNYEIMAVSQFGVESERTIVQIQIQ